MSAKVINNPSISKVAGTAILPFFLVALNSDDEADLCGATDVPIGQSELEVDAGALQGIRLPSAGTLALTASGVIDFLAPVYTAAGGKVSATAADGSHCVGLALEAAGANNDIISVLPSALAALVAQTIAAMTYAAPTATALNTGDATSDAVITSMRTQLIALAADVTAIRAALVASKLFAAA